MTRPDPRTTRNWKSRKTLKVVLSKKQTMTFYSEIMVLIIIIIYRYYHYHLHHRHRHHLLLQHYGISSCPVFLTAYQSCELPKTQKFNKISKLSIKCQKCQNVKPKFSSPDDIQKYQIWHYKISVSNIVLQLRILTRDITLHYIRNYL